MQLKPPVAVRFIAAADVTWGLGHRALYNPGEVAAFPPADAERLIAAGIAVLREEAECAPSA